MGRDGGCRNFNNDPNVRTRIVYSKTFREGVDVGGNSVGELIGTESPRYGWDGIRSG